MQLLELGQQLQGMHVVRARTRLLVQTRHGFQVVVHDVGRAGVQDGQRAVQAAAEVGDQHFDAGGGRQFADVRDAIHEVAGAAVAQVVAVHRGDDHVRQLHRGDGAREVLGFFGVQRVGAAMAHITERAAARALVAHDHERGGALAEALADVRARGFFADRVQIVFAQDALDVVEARAGRGGLHADPLGLLQAFGRNDLDGNARRLGLRLLLLRRIVDGLRSGRGGGGSSGGFVRGNSGLGERRHWAPSQPARRTARFETKMAFYPSPLGCAAGGAEGWRPHRMRHGMLGYRLA
ncbi:hypothetical protein D3C72_1434170 [compost metagenome]